MKAFKIGHLNVKGRLISLPLRLSAVTSNLYVLCLLELWKDLELKMQNLKSLLLELVKMFNNDQHG